MDNPLLSVIIPIYNVEQYLDKCVSSVVNQTYKNLEVILVDDGSPDNCPALCDKWAEKDSRIRVVHKKNGGHSDARNAGLDIANGDYIAFLDSDDYIELNAYESMMSDIMNYQADIVSCGMVRESPSGYVEKWGDDSLTVHDHRNSVKLIIRADGLLPVSPNNKIYRNDVIGKTRFDTSLRFAEDIMFIFDIIERVNKWVEHNVIFYHYINNATSLTKKSFTYTRFDEHIVSDRIIASVKDDSELYRIAVAGDIYKSFRTIKQMCVSNNCMEKYPEMRTRIIAHRHDILHSGIYDRNTQIKTILLWLFPHIFKKAIGVYGKRKDVEYAKLAGMEQ